jgi:hypothetical protein
VTILVPGGTFAAPFRQVTALSWAGSALIYGWFYWDNYVFTFGTGFSRRDWDFRFFVPASKASGLAARSGDYASWPSGNTITYPPRFANDVQTFQYGSSSSWTTGCAELASIPYESGDWGIEGIFREDVSGQGGIANWPWSTGPQSPVVIGSPAVYTLTLASTVAAAQVPTEAVSGHSLFSSDPNATGSQYVSVGIYLLTVH